MYKFVVQQGGCGKPYDVKKAEKSANDMLKQGFELVQVYQSTSSGCTGVKSVLVMVFKQQ